MTNDKSEVTETAILLRMIESNPHLMGPAVAQEILKFKVPEGEAKKLAKLAAKARAGKLTDRDERAIEAYSRVGSLLGILKSKAHFALEAKAKQKKTAKSRVGV